MLRRLFTLLSAVALLLCAAAVLHGQAAGGHVVLRDGGGGFAGGSDVATIVLFANDRWVGVGWTHSDVRYEGSVRLPIPLLAAVAAILPLRWLGGQIAADRTCRRRRLRLCPACGYDLRATPGRCPECGAEPKGMAA